MLLFSPHDSITTVSIQDSLLILLFSFLSYNQRTSRPSYRDNRYGCKNNALDYAPVLILLEGNFNQHLELRN